MALSTLRVRLPRLFQGTIATGLLSGSKSPCVDKALYQAQQKFSFGTWLGTYPSKMQQKYHFGTWISPSSQINCNTIYHAPYLVQPKSYGTWLAPSSPKHFPKSRTEMYLQIRQMSFKKNLQTLTNRSEEILKTGARVGKDIALVVFEASKLFLFDQVELIKMGLRERLFTIYFTAVVLGGSSAFCWIFDKFGGHVTKFEDFIEGDPALLESEFSKKVWRACFYSFHLLKRFRTEFLGVRQEEVEELRSLLELQEMKVAMLTYKHLKQSEQCAELAYRVECLEGELIKLKQSMTSCDEDTQLLKEVNADGVEAEVVPPKVQEMTGDTSAKDDEA